MDKNILFEIPKSYYRLILGEENMSTTFICNIRVNLTDIASIAQFLDANEIFVKTKSRIASEGIKIFISRMPKEFKVIDHSDALKVLENLGYNKVPQNDAKYKTSLIKALNIEKSAKSMDEIIQEKMQAMEKDKI